MSERIAISSVVNTLFKTYLKKGEQASPSVPDPAWFRPSAAGSLTRDLRRRGGLSIAATTRSAPSSSSLGRCCIVSV